MQLTLLLDGGRILCLFLTVLRRRYIYIGQPEESAPDWDTLRAAVGERQAWADQAKCGARRGDSFIGD